MIKKELLQYYGKCCVSEYTLTEQQDYPEGGDGIRMINRDKLKLENIRGQKQALEHLFELLDKS